MELPSGTRPPVSRDLIMQLDAQRVRAALPDGMMGGHYTRADEDMKVVWEAGVAEVRELIESGWAA